MKKLLPLGLFYLLFLFVCAYSANSQSIVWATSYGGPGKDKGRDIGVDASGNSYVTGFFSDSATFGSQKIYTVGDSIDEDIFIAKFDGNGAPLWAHSFGNGIEDHTDFPYGFSTNETGYSVITGICSNYIKFEKGDSAGTGSLNDMMLVLFDNDGNLKWAKVGGWGNKVQYGSAAFISNDGTIYCTGNFTGDTLNVYGDTLLTFSDSKQRFFTASYTTAGDLLWVNSYASDNTLESRDIKGDEYGNLYVSGNYEGTFNVDYSSITSLGSNDGFIMKLNTNSGFQWVKTFGSSIPNSSESAYTIAVDTSKNLYAASIFNDNITFDGNTITTGSKHNIVVVCYGADGVYKWANSIVGDADAMFSIFCLGLMAEDNVVVTGCFTGVATIDGYLSTTPYGPDPIYSDVLYAAFSPIDGKGQWISHVGGTDTDAGFGLAGNHSGFSYAAGNFHFDGTFGPYTLYADGISDGFVLKFHQNDYLSVPGNLVKQNATAFPVPSNGTLNVSLTPDATLLKFVDELGRVLIEKNVTGKSLETLNLESYSNGNYYLQICGPSSINAVKVILQK
ncbi:MAG: SBBP repeat-containing protein [Chitinophagales bacterium]|nr:SBBP repeat-containing protein [Chitinophagales bacterium]